MQPFLLSRPEEERTLQKAFLFLSPLTIVRMPNFSTYSPYVPKHARKSQARRLLVSACLYLFLSSGSPFLVMTEGFQLLTWYDYPFISPFSLVLVCAQVGFSFSVLFNLRWWFGFGAGRDDTLLPLLLLLLAAFLGGYDIQFRGVRKWKYLWQLLLHSCVIFFFVRLSCC